MALRKPYIYHNLHLPIVGMGTLPWLPSLLVLTRLRTQPCQPW